MKNVISKKNPIAHGVALALGTSMMISPFALSQEEERLLEEVVVTGIRVSMMNAMDVKRDSDGVVDAISAEDMETQDPNEVTVQGMLV